MAPRLIYAGIRVKDMDESIKFYTQVLGMILLEREKFPQTQGECATLKTQASELDHLAFDVEDLGTWIEHLDRKNIKVIVRPHEISGWNEAFIQDPNRIWIEFLQRK